MPLIDSLTADAKAHRESPVIQPQLFVQQQLPVHWHFTRDFYSVPICLCIFYYSVSPTGCQLKNIIFRLYPSINTFPAAAVLPAYLLF